MRAQTPHVPARRAREAGVAQRVGERRLVDGRAIDGLDEHRSQLVGSDLVGERMGEREARRLGIGYVALEREELLLAPAEPAGKPSVDEHDYRAGGPHRLAAFRTLG